MKIAVELCSVQWNQTQGCDANIRFVRGAGVMNKPMDFEECKPAVGRLLALSLTPSMLAPPSPEPPQDDEDESVESDQSLACLRGWAADPFITAKRRQKARRRKPMAIT